MTASSPRSFPMSPGLPGARAVSIRFLPQDLLVVGWVGEPLLDVAQRAGVSIPTGCMQGSCHACEVELDGQPICSCITAVPPSEVELTVDLYSDPTW